MLFENVMLKNVDNAAFFFLGGDSPFLLYFVAIQSFTIQFTERKCR